MNIVVMQYGVICPGATYEELAGQWEALRGKVPEVKKLTVVRDDGSYTGEKLDALIGDADALLGLIIKKDTITRQFFEKHPGLKYIATVSHGYQEFDKQAAKEIGVTVTNTIYGDITIAQYTMALLLDICHNTGMQNDYLKKLYWLQEDKTPYVKSFSRQIELFDKTVGIIGLGAIGLAFAKMAAGMGMKVISYSRNKKSGEEYGFIEQCSMEELMARSDIISLSCPLTKETENLIDREKIAGMKDGVIILNTARGALIDEEALAEALNSRKVYAAGIDVMREEPPAVPGALMLNPYCRVTGHIAWMTKEASLRGIRMAIDNYASYLSGKPVSVIS